MSITDHNGRPLNTPPPPMHPQNVFPVKDTAKFIHLPHVPKRCNTCNKPYTVTRDESGQIFFCTNKNCSRREFGFHQNAAGLILDGRFNKAYNLLERYRF